MVKIILDATNQNWVEILPKKDSSFYFFLTDESVFGFEENGVLDNLNSTDPCFTSYGNAIDSVKIKTFWDFLSGNVNIQFDEPDDIGFYLFNQLELFKIILHFNLDYADSKAFSDKCKLLGNVFPILNKSEEYVKYQDFLVATQEKKQLDCSVVHHLNKSRLKKI